MDERQPVDAGVVDRRREHRTRPVAGGRHDDQGDAGGGASIHGREASSPRRRPVRRRPAPCGDALHFVRDRPHRARGRSSRPGHDRREAPRPQPARAPDGPARHEPRRLRASHPEDRHRRFGVRDRRRRPPARRPDRARHLRALVGRPRRPRPAGRAPDDHQPNTLHLDQPIRDAIELMQTGRFRNVPLVDDGAGSSASSARSTSSSTSPRRSRRSSSTCRRGRTSAWSNRRRVTTDHRDAERRTIQELERVTIRFAGDSGDGMQLTGTQFTRTAAVFGNDISTLPDFPAEIRAPAGSLPGVSGFQLSFSVDRHPHARRRARRARGDEPGRAQDQPRRPAGGRRADRQQRRVHASNLKKAGYAANPLTDGSLKAVQRLRDPDLHAQRARRSRGST